MICLGLTACAAAPSTVRVDKADADLSKCRTFDWLSTSQDAASLTEQRVRAAALQQLERKGYVLTTEKPDCRVTYILTTHERAAQKPRVGVGAGGGPGGVSGGIGISLPIGQQSQTSAEFTLDVIDVASNAQVWRGSIDAAFDQAEPSADEAAKVVEKVLAEFPER